MEKKISEEEYNKAKDIISQWHRENPTPQEIQYRETRAKQEKCEHEWELDEGWGGHIEGNTHCSKCGLDNPSNYY